MQELVCKKCGYHWFTKSTRKRISCSKCKTSITLMPTRNPNKPRTTIEPISSKPLVSEKIYMPLAMAETLNRFMLARLIGMAKSNGDDHIRFKIDEKGIMKLEG